MARMTTKAFDEDLYPHQREALRKLKTGSVLCGGVGTGKSRTAIAYFFDKSGADREGKGPHDIFYKDLYIITTARKRDTLDWDKEFTSFGLSTKREFSVDGILVTVDSWNNIGKYVDVEKAFFIFDEQRVVGHGAWVKAFLKITKKNDWILLSATPGDTWMDYIPVFIANGFYRNRTEFVREHCVFNQYSKYPKIDRFLGTDKLERLRDSILVTMPYKKRTEKHLIYEQVKFDEDMMKNVERGRWNPYLSEPIQNSSEYFQLLRRVANSNLSRYDRVLHILEEKKKAVIFYNFDYELLILRELAKEGIEVAEWNGHVHQPIPESDKWAYLVQYTAGSEGWNCIETDTVIFYSLNYSYRTMIQSAGRIDRLNTRFVDLYYYVLVSNSFIDNSINKCLKNKKNFNENIVKF